MSFVVSLVFSQLLDLEHNVQTLWRHSVELWHLCLEFGFPLAQLLSLSLSSGLEHRFGRCVVFVDLIGPEVLKVVHFLLEGSLNLLSFSMLLLVDVLDPSSLQILAKSLNLFLESGSLQEVTGGLMVQPFLVELSPK